MKPSTPSPPAAEQSWDCLEVSLPLLLRTHLVKMLRLFEEHAGLHLIRFVPELLRVPVLQVGLEELLNVLRAVAVGWRQVEVRADCPHGTNFPGPRQIFLIIQTLQTMCLLEFHIHQQLLFLQKIVWLNLLRNAIITVTLTFIRT